MAVTSGTAATRGPGRPRKAHGPPDESNPEFRAFRTACAIEEILYDAVQRVAACGTAPPDALADARTLLLGLDVMDLGVTYASFAQRVAALTFSSSTQLASPLAQADASTAWLLGKGRWWFRDKLRSVPLDWRPSKRPPFSSTPVLSAPGKHASRHDAFTPSERVFYDPRFPAAARSAVEVAARGLLSRAGCCDLRRGLTSRICDSCWALDYFRGSATRRAGIPPPAGLETIVWNAVKRLPQRLRRSVYELTRRYRRPSRAGASWRISRVTPLPALGPLRRRAFRPREPKHP